MSGYLRRKKMERDSQIGIINKELDTMSVMVH